MVGGEGKEGDWECSGCKNRNYGFRSFCNRCKQPRLLVDNQTPGGHSKWLPRVGDWICLGCTNNNYASREKCKKCAQPKEVSAMPAIAAMSQGLVGDQRTNIPLFANRTMQPLNTSNNWSLGGMQQTPYFKFDAASNLSNQILMGSKGWRNGDWVCTCGFHNYASRAECKKCNATMPPALGTKRLASDEINELDSKRPNVGPAFGLQRAYPSLDQSTIFSGKPTTGVYLSSPYLSGSSSMVPNLQTNLHYYPVGATPTLLDKGAKQWREGDWMCTKCNNHNYASRPQCNRCKAEKDAPAQSVGVS